MLSCCCLGDGEGEATVRRRGLNALAVIGKLRWFTPNRIRFFEQRDGPNILGTQGVCFYGVVGARRAPQYRLLRRRADAGTGDVVCEKFCGVLLFRDIPLTYGCLEHPSVSPTTMRESRFWMLSICQPWSFLVPFTSCKKTLDLARVIVQHCRRLSYTLSDSVPEGFI